MIATNKKTIKSLEEVWEWKEKSSRDLHDKDDLVKYLKKQTSDLSKKYGLKKVDRNSISEM